MFFTCYDDDDHYDDGQKLGEKSWVNVLFLQLRLESRLHGIGHPFSTDMRIYSDRKCWECVFALVLRFCFA